MKAEPAQADGKRTSEDLSQRSPALQAQPGQLSPQLGPFHVVVEEISRCEATAADCAAELERLVADDSVVLGRLLQIRSQEIELKAYIRGLKFFSSNFSSSVGG